jgi:hypothetical protein
MQGACGDVSEGAISLRRIRLEEETRLTIQRDGRTKMEVPPIAAEERLATFHIIES